MGKILAFKNICTIPTGQFLGDNLPLKQQNYGNPVTPSLEARDREGQVSPAGNKSRDPSGSE